MTDKLEKIDDSKNLRHVKQTMDKIATELNKKPDPKHIKKNKFANNSNYLEIGYIQAQLDRQFLQWDWQIDNVQQIAVGVVVNGTLTVYTAAGNKIIRSGVGSVSIQTVKGSTTLDPSTIGKGAMDKDPARAEAYALKNAAAKLGNAFGRGLNRGFNHEHIPDEGLTDRILGEV